MKPSVVVLVLIVAVMAGVMVVRGGRELRPEASAQIEREHALEGRPGARLAADAVLSISPRVAGMSSGAMPAVPRLSPAMHEFTFTRAYKPIHDRLKAADRRTPEETWILAKILDDCAKVADRQDLAKRSMLGGDARGRFVASLSPKDPRREQRIAAFDAINADRCEGLRDAKTTEKEIRDLLAQSASAGDPKAAADLVFKDLLARSKDANGRFRVENGAMITDAEIETLKRSMESGDPQALTEAVRTFILPLGNLSLRAGPDQRPIDATALYGATQLVACDLGAACGPDSPALLKACALHGQCDAASFREYLFYYAMPPESSQQVAQYYSYFTQAVKNHDWSAFTFSRPDHAPSVSR